MRLPLIPQLSTKDGVQNKNARMTNVLVDKDEQGDFAAIRPGLRQISDTTGEGRGLVNYNDQLISVYGSTLGFLTQPEYSRTIFNVNLPVGSTSQYIFGVTDSPTGYVGVGQINQSGTKRVFVSSSDGLTWDMTVMYDPYGAPLSISGFKYFLGEYRSFAYLETSLGSGIYQPSSIKSTDGVNWTIQSEIPDHDAYDTGLFRSYMVVHDTFYMYSYNTALSQYGLVSTTDCDTWVWATDLLGYQQVVGNKDIRCALKRLTNDLVCKVTRDGGTSWQEITIPNVSGALNSISYADGVFYLMTNYWGEYPANTATLVTTEDFLSWKHIHIPYTMQDDISAMVASDRSVVFLDFYEAYYAYDTVAQQFSRTAVVRSLGNTELSQTSSGAFCDQSVSDGFFEAILFPTDRIRSIAPLEDTFFDFAQSPL